MHSGKENCSKGSNDKHGKGAPAVKDSAKPKKTAKTGKSGKGQTRKGNTPAKPAKPGKK